MNDEPPIIVQSWYRGASRRYSHSAVLGMRLWPAAANTPSTPRGEAAVRQRAVYTLRHQPDDAHARCDFAEVDSATPTMAARRAFGWPSCVLHRIEDG
jgi:hypothetical protein